MYSTREKNKYAKQLRKHPTGGENSLRLWLWIAGYKYQHYDSAGYLPDFYSKFAGVAIEVDGSIHKRKEVKAMDKAKDKARRSKHNYTLRVSNRLAQKAPLIVFIEAVLTGVIYKLWRITVWIVKYLWWVIKLTPSKRPTL